MAKFRWLDRATYLLSSWGIKRKPGNTRNAGKVMRLKIPKTEMMPRMVHARREERCCWMLFGASFRRVLLRTHRSIHDALNQNHAPRNNERLDGVGESVRLVRPSDVGRRDEQYCDAAVARRLDELVNCPVLEDEADDEHEDAEGPENGNGRHLAGLAVPNPQPLQEKHGKAVDRPEGENAPDRVVACEFPCVTDRITEDLACKMSA